MSDKAQADQKLELVRNLARLLALEYSDVEDEDLSTVDEGADAIKEAQSMLRSVNLHDKYIDMFLERYRKHVEAS
jgi:hypothetical protein